MTELVMMNHSSKTVDYHCLIQKEMVLKTTPQFIFLLNWQERQTQLKPSAVGRIDTK
jgi:hypothetical protein